MFTKGVIVLDLEKVRDNYKLAADRKLQEYWMNLGASHAIEALIQEAKKEEEQDAE